MHHIIGIVCKLFQTVIKVRADLLIEIKSQQNKQTKRKETEKSLKKQKRRRRKQTNNKQQRYEYRSDPITVRYTECDYCLFCAH